MITGTLVNTLAVLLGSSIGLTINKKLPERLVQPVFNFLGLFTIFLGMKMALEINQTLIVLISIILGVLSGELLYLDEKFHKAAHKLKKQLKNRNPRFAEGIITSFFLFCIGSFTILAAIEEASGKEPVLFYTKSILDGISSIFLAATFGAGLLITAVLLFIFQSSLTLLSGYFMEFLNESLIQDIGATGGIIMLGLGINLLKIKEIKITNALPALVFTPFITFILDWIKTI